ncbi:hypothetical protein V8D89_006529 [Ganoderma adspersum]
MQNILLSEFANRNGYTPTSGDLAQPPTMHRAIQPHSPPHVEGRKTPHQIDADAIESILIDTKVRIDLLLDDSDCPVLPLSRKVFREAVACGLLRLVRDPAGQVVRVENVHSHPYPELSIETINSMFGPGAQSDEFMIGSDYPQAVTGGNGSGDSDDVDVNWAAVFSSRNDGLNLAERGETRPQATWAALDGGRGDGDMHTFVQGPGPASRRYGGGSAAAQL